jgi:hypothetical protein
MAAVAFDDAERAVRGAEQAVGSGEKLDELGLAAGGTFAGFGVYGYAAFPVSMRSGIR